MPCLFRCLLPPSPSPIPPPHMGASHSNKWEGDLVGDQLEVRQGGRWGRRIRDVPLTTTHSPSSGSTHSFRGSHSCLPLPPCVDGSLCPFPLLCGPPTHTWPQFYPIFRLLHYYARQTLHGHTMWLWLVPCPPPHLAFVHLIHSPSAPHSPYIPHLNSLFPSGFTPSLPIASPHTPFPLTQVLKHLPIALTAFPTATHTPPPHHITCPTAHTCPTWACRWAFLDPPATVLPAPYSPACGITYLTFPGPYGLVHATHLTAPCPDLPSSILCSSILGQQPYSAILQNKLPSQVPPLLCHSWIHWVGPFIMEI